MFNFFEESTLITSTDALKGRQEPISLNQKHYINGRSLNGPWEDYDFCILGMGCFWGAERIFWNLKGVYVTSVGYAGGFTPNPTYEEVCSGKTGHAEVVQVVFDKQNCNYSDLLKLFFESHNPTQGMRQGNDRGTQYRSIILYKNEQQKVEANQIKDNYNQSLTRNGFNCITTEINEYKDYFLAEEYHQQYLAKNPNGYCGLQGTGIECQK